MKKKLLTLTVAFATSMATLAAQNVNIPDANFKAYLVGSSSINTNSDTEIQVSEATAFTGVIACSNLSITTLTGIEAFTSLTQLYCSNNQLTALDVSNNTSLGALHCYNNQLTALDVNASLGTLSCYNNQLTALDLSNNTTLINLYCYNNQLTALDLSNNISLITLSCYDNQLTALDLSNNTSLQALSCYDNQLTALDLSNNTSLITLSCYNNQLAALDLSNNTSLITLSCYYNQLTALDLSNNTTLTQLYCNSNQLTDLDLSNNTSLINLYCNNNQLTTLDLSNNTSLTQLYCNNNQLTDLDVKNGNNSNFINFSASNNPDLTCIQVDDAAYSTTNWTSIDAASSFRENCSLSTGIYNHLFENSIKIYPNPTKDQINFSVQTNAQLTNVSGQIVADKKNVNTIDLSDQPTGIYFLTLSNNEGQVVQRIKIVKE